MIINIKDLRAKTLIGIYPEERMTPREVVLNLAITVEYAKTIALDDIAHTADYAQIEQVIVDSLAKQDFALIETLAEHVATLVMQFPPVVTVTVEIDKPGVMRYARSVSVIHTVSR